jgi:hypothetical protein
MTLRTVADVSGDWRSRWLVCGATGKALHRIATIRWEDPYDAIAGRGVTVCGLRGRFRVPGLFSRLGLRRCVRCCVRLGIPAGPGAPFNALKGRGQHV